MSPRRTSYAGRLELPLAHLVAHCRRRQAQRLLGQLGGRPDRPARSRLAGRLFESERSFGRGPLCAEGQVAGALLTIDAGQAHVERAA